MGALANEIVDVYIREGSYRWAPLQGRSRMAVMRGAPPAVPPGLSALVTDAEIAADVACAESASASGEAADFVPWPISIFFDPTKRSVPEAKAVALWLARPPTPPDADAYKAYARGERAKLPTANDPQPQASAMSSAEAFVWTAAPQGSAEATVFRAAMGAYNAGVCMGQELDRGTTGLCRPHGGPHDIQRRSTRRCGS